MSFGFYFAVYYGSEALVNPGGYTQGVTLGISNSLQPNGENVTLSSTAPAGLNVTFTPKSPVFLTGAKALNVTLTITASSTVATGNYTIGLKGVSGANSQTASFSIDVVQYRVVMTQNTFFPGVLNVTVGSTVYWQNFDGPAGGCGVSTGSGQHNVVFTTLQGANSSTINQFQIYKYTFTTAGSYFYYSSLDTDHLMNGTINVVGSGGGGGGGMAVNMPAFSFFKNGGALEVPPGAIAATAPAGGEAATAPTAARGLGFGDLGFLDAHSSPFSGVGLGAAIGVLLGLAALGAALAVSTTRNRGLTAMGARRFSRPLPSDASR